MWCGVVLAFRAGVVPGVVWCGVVRCGGVLLLCCCVVFARLCCIMLSAVLCLGQLKKSEMTAVQKS